MTTTRSKVSIAGLLIALGIIFGDIGTSPLYVLNAIIKEKTISEQLIDHWLPFPHYMDTNSSDNYQICYFRWIKSDVFILLPENK